MSPGLPPPPWPLAHWAAIAGAWASPARRTTEAGTYLPDDDPLGFRDSVHVPATGRSLPGAQHPVPAWSTRRVSVLTGTYDATDLAPDHSDRLDHPAFICEKCPCTASDSEHHTSTANACRGTGSSASHWVRPRARPSPGLRPNDILALSLEASHFAVPCLLLQCPLNGSERVYINEPQTGHTDSFPVRTMPPPRPLPMRRADSFAAHFMIFSNMITTMNILLPSY